MADFDKSIQNKRIQIHQNRINFALIDCKKGIPVKVVLAKYKNERYGLTAGVLATALRRRGFKIGTKDLR